MWRAMLDTDTPLQLPFSTGLLATYADLADAPVLAHLEQLHTTVVWIDRGLGDPAHLATVLDVEAHAQGATGAPAWYDSQHARGRQFLTVYANRSTMPEVNREMGPRPFYRWIARLDGIATVPGFTPGQGPAAVQVMGAAALGIHADYSIVYNAAWNPGPAPSLDSADHTLIASATVHLRSALASLAGVK